MNPEEAKLYLAASRRCDRRDADDRAVEAWECLDGNEELAQWFEHEQECIGALDEKLGGIVPPPALRSQISASCGEARPQRRLRRRPVLLAAAAALVLSLVGVILWMKRPFASGEESLVAYRNDMAAFLDRFFVLDYQSDKVSDVRAWLTRKHGLDHFAVPASLAAYPSLGCEVIPWHGRKSFLICFDVDGELVHLFLLPGGKTLDSGSLGPVPEFETIGGKWAACSWADGDELYFCCTLGAEGFLRDCLAARFAPGRPGGERVIALGHGPAPPVSRLPGSGRSARGRPQPGRG